MKIAHKLVGSFIGVSLLTFVVGAVAIAQSRKMAESLAILEAKHVAQMLATSIAEDLYGEDLSPEVAAESLQSYVTLLHHKQNRDSVVVNLQKKILAHPHPQDIGTVFDDDQGKEVNQTLQDGKVRTFLTQESYHGQTAQMMVVPLYKDASTIDGAVILEYSSMYAEAISFARPTIVIIGVTSLGCVTLALFFGIRIASHINKPLKLATSIAQQVTQSSNFDLQVPVISQDETGILGTALNHLIQKVKELLLEKEQQTQAIQQTLEQLHKAQLQLVQTEKMSSLGRLIAGIAHEINNPVNFIHGNITHIDNYSQNLLNLVAVYQYHYPDTPEKIQIILDAMELEFIQEDLPKLLQSMQVGTERIRQIVLSLRNFSRLDESEFKYVDIHEGIENTLLILQHRLKTKPDNPGIQIIKEYAKLPLIECYAGQLNQVFMNLLANAIDAVDELLIEQKKDSLPQRQGMIYISTQLIADHFVQITIADNGLGIPETVRSRIFDPFFTTKPVGKGTGLGLSISYNIIVEKHHGKMWCDSQLGEGTKFVIQVPISHPKQKIPTDSISLSL
jgi:signal transduction histidine kinase